MIGRGEQFTYTSTVRQNHFLTAWSTKAKSDISNSKFPPSEMFFTKIMVGENVTFPINTPQYRTI